MKWSRSVVKSSWRSGFLRGWDETGVAGRLDPKARNTINNTF